LLLTIEILARAARAVIPSIIASMLVTGSSGGNMSDNNATRGVAPIAARSLRLTASALWPMSAAATHARSKWTPSTRQSVI
jgi:hypothetical protein